MVSQQHLTAALVNSVNQAWASVLKLNQHAGRLEVTSVLPLLVEFTVYPDTAPTTPRAYRVGLSLVGSGADVSFQASGSHAADSLDEHLAEGLADALAGAVGRHLPEADEGAAATRPAGATLH